MQGGGKRSGIMKEAKQTLAWWWGRDVQSLESCEKQRAAPPPPHSSPPTPHSVSLAGRFLEDIFPGKEEGWRLGPDFWIGFPQPPVAGGS